MTRESQQWEKKLKEAGWKPPAAHPNSPTWLHPHGKTLYPGPGYAHSRDDRAEQAEGQTTMSTPQTQRGYVFLSGKAFHIRYYVHEKGVRKQRSRKLCPKNEQHFSKEAPSVVALAETFMATINAANAANDNRAGHNCPICGNRCKRTIEQKFASQL